MTAGGWRLLPVNKLQKNPLFCLGLACGALFYLPLGLRALWDPGEGRIAEIAREMLERSDWLTPHLHGAAFLKEPPLMYWLTALALGVSGPSVLAMRFGCAAFGLLTVWVTYHLGKNWRNERVGLLAAAMLATSLGFFIFTQYLTLDMVFTFWTTVALYAGTGLLVERSAQRARRLLIFLVVGVSGGIMTRGWGALGLPALTLLAVTLGQGRRPAMPKLPWKMALMCCGLLTLPWFIRASLMNPAFLHEYFVPRFPRLSFDVFLVLLIGFLPWIVFLPKAAVTWFAHRHAAPRRDPEGAALVAWTCLVFIYCALLHSKGAGSLLPVFPALALLVANEFDEALGESDLEPTPPPPPWVGGGLAALIVIFFAAMVFLKVRPAVLSMGRPEWKVVFDQSDSLTLALGVGIFVLVGVWGMRQTLSCLGGVLLVQVLLLTSASSLAPALDAFRSTRQIADRLESRDAPGEQMVVYGLGNKIPSLSFYLRRVPVFLPSGSPQALHGLPAGSWGVADFSHWQTLRQSAPPSAFQLMNQSGERVLFRKER